MSDAAVHVRSARRTAARTISRVRKPSSVVKGLHSLWISRFTGALPLTASRPLVHQHLSTHAKIDASRIGIASGCSRRSSWRVYVDQHLLPVTQARADARVAPGGGRLFGALYLYGARRCASGMLFPSRRRVRTPVS